MKNLAVNWFDIVAIILVLWGLYRGKKRGMSVEILSVLQVLLILVIGGLYYEPLGQKLAQKTQIFSLLSCYMAVYITIAILVMFVFANLKRLVGDKLVSSDAFGRGEYYVGMLAGGLRYVALILVFMSLLNARAISNANIAKSAKAQQDDLGMTFPTFGSIQKDILRDSQSGKFAQEHLAQLLIKPTVPENKGIPLREGTAKKMERQADELLNTTPPKK